MMKRTLGLSALAISFFLSGTNRYPVQGLRLHDVVELPALVEEPLERRLLLLVPSEYRFRGFGWKKCSAAASTWKALSVRRNAPMSLSAFMASGLTVLLAAAAGVVLAAGFVAGAAAKVVATTTAAAATRTPPLSRYRDFIGHLH